MHSNCSIFYIKNLYNYGNFFGLTPPFDFKTGKPRLAEHHKTIGFLRALIITITWILSFWDRIVTSYPIFPSSSLIATDSALFFVLYLTNISSILLPSLKCSRHFYQFLKLYFEYDKLVTLTRLRKFERNMKCFYAELVIGHIAMISLYMVDAYVWVTFLGILYYKAYISRLFMNYLVYIMILLIYNFILSFYYRFKTINNVLYDSFVNLNRVKKIRQCTTFPFFNNEETTKIILHLCENLTEQISLFNLIFGWQLLFFFGVNFIILIDSINYLYTFGVLGFDQQGSINLILLEVAWTIVSLVLGVLIVTSCSRTTGEIQKTSKMCYKILIYYSTENNCNQKMIDQLNLLLQILNQDSIHFTAAGFFNINYSLLLTIFSSVTSYIIVIVQLSK